MSIGYIDKTMLAITGALGTQHRSSCSANKIDYVIHAIKVQGRSHKNVMSSLAWQIPGLTDSTSPIPLTAHDRHRRMSVLGNWRNWL